MGKVWTRALVTGASSGIGERFAELLAERSTELVVVARSRDRLEALADRLPTHVEVLRADLGDPDDLDRVMSRVASESSPVDLVINNAGVGSVGSFADTDLSVSSRMLDVNVGALVRVTHAAANAMRRRDRGHILNVASVAGSIPGPGTAVYNASKAFVRSFSEAVHEELRDEGVVVSALCPGLVRTPFQDVAGASVDGIPAMMWCDLDEVARAGLDGVLRGRAVIVPGLTYKGIVGLTHVLPSAVTRRVMGGARPTPIAAQQH